VSNSDSGGGAIWLLVIVVVYVMILLYVVLPVGSVWGAFIAIRNYCRAFYRNVNRKTATV